MKAYLEEGPFNGRIVTPDLVVQSPSGVEVIWVDDYCRYARVRADIEVDGVEYPHFRWDPLTNEEKARIEAE